jgi:hypothetical protein
LGERFYIYASKKRAAGSGPVRQAQGRQRAAEGGGFDKLTAGGFDKLTAGGFDKLTAGGFDKLTAGIWSRELSVPELAAGALPWMLELAEAIKLFGPDVQLPTGVIVGSAVIERVSPREDGMWQWHLADVERAKRLRKPRGHPQV